MKIKKGVCYEKDSIRVGVFLDQTLLKRCDGAVPPTDCRSRSKFISRAIDLYVTQLNSEGDTRLLLPALDNYLGGRMSVQETRLSRILFKLAVEVAIMSHIVAGTNEVTDGQLASIRRLCVDEVKRLSGRYSMEDAVRFQN